ncbi:MFS transporter [Catellatospora sp. NPDC049609]|uniref:MFS transporter n=1 Tax=Catellatospora sp. NPDC049609 TaxID=3155505 RepID=UPI00342D51B7
MTATTLAPPRVRSGSVLSSIFVTLLAYAMLQGGVNGILIPAQLAEIAPDRKVELLGLISAVGSVVVMLANPLLGALSDRTRSRFGRRTPWVVLGAFGAAAGIMLMGLSTTLVVIAGWWAVANLFGTGTLAATLAYVPDRVPADRRGVASTVTGLSAFVGVVLGSVAAAALVGRPLLGYGVLALGSVLSALWFAARSGDASSADAERTPWHWRRFAAGFWISPRRHPDFAWAFVARFAMTLGFNAIQVYLLYILTDYIGMSLADGARTSAGLNLVLVAGIILGILPAGVISDRLDRRKGMVVVSSIVIGTSALIPLIWPTLPAMYWFVGVCGLGYGVYAAVDQALMTLVLPSAADNGKDMGVLNIANAGAQSLSPLFAALIISTLGGYEALFVTAIALAAVATITILPIRSVR